MAIVESLREKLRNSTAELASMALALEEQRKRAENTLTLLAAARTVKNDLNKKICRRVKKKGFNPTNELFDKKMSSFIKNVINSKEFSEIEIKPFEKVGQMSELILIWDYKPKDKANE